MKSHQTSLQYKGLVSFSWRNCLSITKLCLGCTTNKNMSDFNKASSKSEGQFAFWERPRMILVLKKVTKKWDGGICSMGILLKVDQNKYVLFYFDFIDIRSNN